MAGARPERSEPGAARSGACWPWCAATGQDPFHHRARPATRSPARPCKSPILDALGRLDWDKLTDPQRLDLLRVYGLLFNRMGWPDRAARARLIQRFDPLFPAQGPRAERRALPAARLPGSRRASPPRR